MADAVSQVAKSATGAPAAGSHDLGPDPSLLIVDDDAPFLRRLARAMESRGFVVELAGSVAEGIAKAKEAAPSYAVVDLRAGSERQALRVWVVVLHALDRVLDKVEDVVAAVLIVTVACATAAIDPDPNARATVNRETGPTVLQVLDVGAT